MATYKPMQSIRLTADTTTVTFSGISQDYTDLEIVISARCSHSSNSNFYYRVNGDTSSSYSVTRLQGNGSTAVSNRGSSNTVGYIGYTDAADSSAGIFGNTKIYINNYSNSTTYKTLVSKGSTPGTSGYAAAFANLYRGSTSPITSISFTPDAGNWVAGSTFDLYGIKSGAPQALGGDVVTTDGNYWYHAFRSTGAFIPQRNLTADVLQIAGGGGGGYTFNGGAGGGGAGGIFYATAQSLISTNYIVTVGSGGPQVYEGAFANGNDSQFGSLTLSKGGGQGGRQYGGGFPGAAGGSGGGGGGAPGGSGNAGGASTQTSTGGTGYGNAGGQGATGGADQRGGGGGGAGAAGTVGNSNGAGGAGLNTWSSWASATGTGVSGFYAGGGGGNPNGSAGSGGGGASGVAGTANTGSGGGGGTNQGSGASGGSGIVIVRYPV